MFCIFLIYRPRLTPSVILFYLVVVMALQQWPPSRHEDDISRFAILMVRLSSVSLTKRASRLITTRGVTHGAKMALQHGDLKRRADLPLI